MFDTNFGTDPEIFVVDKNGCVPPAFMRLELGLENDGKTLWKGDEWKVIEDGAATEINVDPSDDPLVIFTRMRRARDFVQSYVNEKWGYSVDESATVKFDVDRYWNGRDEEFKDCVRFGCDPHLDIYSGEYSQEVATDDVDERFGGGHIHMQSPEDNPNLFEDLYYYSTQLMDLLVGNTIVGFRRDKKDLSKELARLKYYGMPGTIRLQDYESGAKGIEYRVPSNFWIKSPETVTASLGMMNCVYNLSRNPDDASRFLNDTGALSRACKNIISSRVEEASTLSLEMLDHLCEMRYVDFNFVADVIELLQVN